jgi:hypothetical protein
VSEIPDIPHPSESLESQDERVEAAAAELRRVLILHANTPYDWRSAARAALTAAGFFDLRRELTTTQERAEKAEARHRALVPDCSYPECVDMGQMCRGACLRTQLILHEAKEADDAAKTSSDQGQVRATPSSEGE